MRLLNLLMSDSCGSRQLLGGSDDSHSSSNGSRGSNDSDGSLYFASNCCVVRHDAIRYHADYWKDDDHDCSHHDSSDPACQSVNVRYCGLGGSGHDGRDSSRIRLPHATHVRRDSLHRRQDVRRRSSRGADSGHRRQSARNRQASIGDGKSRMLPGRLPTASPAGYSSNPSCDAPNICHIRRHGSSRPSDSRG